MIKLKDLLFEKRVRLSTMKDANFEPGQYVQLMGKKGMVKLDKKSVKYLAKWIRQNSGKHGMGWSFTEGKLTESLGHWSNTLKQLIKWGFGDVEISFKGKSFGKIKDLKRHPKGSGLTLQAFNTLLKNKAIIYKPDGTYQQTSKIRKYMKAGTLQLEGKLNEGTTLTLPNGVKVKLDFKGVTFISKTSKPVFLDRDELQKFFQATTKYLRYS